MFLPPFCFFLTQCMRNLHADGFIIWVNCVINTVITKETKLVKPLLLLTHARGVTFPNLTKLLCDH